MLPADPARAAVFVPGHLGELTQVITSALVDEVLAATRRASAGSASCHRGWWRTSCSRWGCSVPRATGRDGTGLQIPDTSANAGFFGRRTGLHGLSGYPVLRLSAQVECGTRALIDVVFDPLAVHEKKQCAVLCRALASGMLLSADRGSDGYPLMSQAAATGAQLLWRIQSHRQLPVVHKLPDGSYLSTIPADAGSRDRLATWSHRRHTIPPQTRGLAVRVIEAVITATGADGSAKTGTLRLVTTLSDHERHPAGELAALYHQRWEAQTAYFGLKVTLRGAGRVLRSGSVDGIRHEVFGLLIVYQATRRIAAQAEADAGIDPDRISIIVTLRTARLTVTGASGTGNVPDVGRALRIRAAVLPRRVKRTITPFAYNKTRNDKPDTQSDHRHRHRHRRRRTHRGVDDQLRALTSRH